MAKKKTANKVAKTKKPATKKKDGGEIKYRADGTASWTFGK
jgi:hypothetical protein